MNQNCSVPRRGKRPLAPTPIHASIQQHQKIRYQLPTFPVVHCRALVEPRLSVMHLQRSTHSVLYLEARPQFICSAAGGRLSALLRLSDGAKCSLGTGRPQAHGTPLGEPDCHWPPQAGDRPVWGGLINAAPIEVTDQRGEEAGTDLGLLSGGSWGRAELIVCIENCNRISLLSASYHAEKKYRLKAMDKELGIYKNKSLFLARSRYRSRVSDTPSDIAQGIEADFDGITFDPTNPLPIHPCLPQYWFRVR